jgi:hypothetical protein
LLSNQRVVNGSIVKKDIYVFNYIIIVESVLTRFNPGNAHICGLSRHRALVGSGKLDGDKTKAKGHKFYPGLAPLIG